MNESYGSWCDIGVCSNSVILVNKIIIFFFSRYVATKDKIVCD